MTSWSDVEEERNRRKQRYKERIRLKAGGVVEFLPAYVGV